jgi:predicted DNA-binding transcriptional regulator
MSEEKVEAAKAEVQRLLDAGFIRELVYPGWLGNVIMVRKKNGK